jgi:hypothetical protein
MFLLPLVFEQARRFIIPPIVTGNCQHKVAKPNSDQNRIWMPNLDDRMAVIWSPDVAKLKSTLHKFVRIQD